MKERWKGLSRNLRLLSLVSLTFTTGMGFYAFIMPAYARELGATPAQFGAILSGSFALGTLTVIPGGIWADKYDRRGLMIAGWALALPFTLLCSMARSWVLLVPAYVLFYVSFFSGPAFGAYVTVSSPPDALGTAWGVLGAAESLGLVVGPAAGALLIRTLGVRGMFLCALVFQAASLGLLFLLEPQPAGLRERTAAGASAGGSGAGPGAGGGAVRATGGLLGVMAFLTVFHLLVTVASSFVALYMQDRTGLDLGRLSLFGSAPALGGLVLAPFIGGIRDRLGPRQAFRLVLGLMFLAFAGLLATSWPPALFFVLMLRGGETAGGAIAQAEVGARARRAAVGRTIAAYNLCLGLGRSAGPYIGGRLYGVDPRLPFGTAACGSVALAFLAGPALGSPGDRRGQGKSGGLQDTRGPALGPGARRSSTS